MRGNGEGGRHINYGGVSFTTRNSSRQLARTSGALGSKYTHCRADLHTRWCARTHRCTVQIVERTRAMLTLADLLLRRPFGFSVGAWANNLGGRSFVLTAGRT